MGKGLSPLQQNILKLAAELSPKGMTTRDVLEQVWGWEPAPPGHKIPYTRTTHSYASEGKHISSTQVMMSVQIQQSLGEDVKGLGIKYIERTWDQERTMPGGETFASDLVGGKKKYESVRASTSRSIRRLIERGLLKGRYGPCRITPKGKKVWLAIQEKVE